MAPASLLQQSSDLPEPSDPMVPDVETLGWVPVLDEDFDGPTLDETIWKVHEGPGTSGPGTYTRDAVGIEDGNLTITTYSEQEDSNLRHYTGEVRSGFGADWAGFMSTYGYIEARVRLNNPPTTRSAFWMLSPSWHHAPLHDPAAAGPEIDLFEEVDPGWDNECPGKDVSSLPCDEIAASTLHWNGFKEDYGRSPQRVQWDGPSPQGNYLTYGLLWTPDGYWMFRNGRQTYHSTEAITYSPEYLILSQTSWADDPKYEDAVPQGGFGSLEEAEGKMAVDYVRVWQKPVSAIADQSTSVNEPVSVPFNVTDFVAANPAHDDPGSVRVTASSDDTTVVPDENIVVTGNGPANPGGSFTEGDFEGGTQEWNLSGTASVWDDVSYSGTNSLRLEKAGGRAEQTITGLEPNTTYLLRAKYNLELEWNDTNSNGQVDEGESFPDNTGSLAWFDMGVEDPVNNRVQALSTKKRDGDKEKGQWWSVHQDDWLGNVVMFTTAPGVTEATVFVDNTAHAGKPRDSNVSVDEMWLKPLVPPNRTVTVQPKSGAVGEATIELTAVDEDDQELGTETFTVTVDENGSFTNGSFESLIPEESGWDLLTYGGTEVVTEDPFEANRVLELASGEAFGTAFQDVTGLEANTSYVVAFRARVEEVGGSVGVAVDDYGGPQVNKEVESVEWDDETIQFTTDSTGTAKITVLDWNVVDGASWVDDLRLYPAAAGSPPTMTAPFILDVGEQQLVTDRPYNIPVDMRYATFDSITSSNPDLLPDRNIGVAGAFLSRTISLTPLPDRTGKATLTVGYTSLADGTSDTHDIPIVVSTKQLDDPGFEQGSSGWDLTDGGDIVGDDEQRSGTSALSLADGDEVTQLIDGLPHNREYALGGWVRGDVEVTVTTRPDDSQVPPASAYEEEFTTTWSGSDWTENELLIKTTQCSGCRAKGSLARDETDPDPDALTITKGGQIEVTFSGIDPQDESFLDDLYLIHAPAISRIEDLSVHTNHVNFTGAARRVLSVGRISPQARWDPAMMELTSSDESVLPLDNIQLTHAATGQHNLSPFRWAIEVRAREPGQPVVTGRSEVTIKLTDPNTGLTAEESFTVTINAGNNFNNGDFERSTSFSSSGWVHAWTNDSVDLRDRQAWRGLGPVDKDRVLRISSGAVGFNVTGLDPGTDYVVRASAMGSGSSLKATATDGNPILWGTPRGSVPINSQQWAPTPDLEFTTAAGETEVWIFIEDADGGGNPVPASNRACTLFAAGETCIDDIGLFKTADLN